MFETISRGIISLVLDWHQTRIQSNPTTHLYEIYENSEANAMSK